MKSIVTGGAGFIGSHLVDKLLSLNHQVIVLDNFSTGKKSNLLNLQKKKVKIIKIDISQNKKLDRYFKGVDYVFHLAGLADIVPSIENPDKYFKSNVIGTFNVMQAAKKAKVKKFIYAASASCYGIPDKFPTNENEQIKPMYPYAFTKWQAEELIMHWVKVYNFPAISLRFFNCYGPRSRTSGAYGAVFGVFLAQKLANKPLTIVGNGKQTRDFVHVKDVVDAIIKSLTNKNARGQIINIGSGKPIKIRKVIEKIRKISKGGFPQYGEFKLRKFEIPKLYPNIQKAKDKINWKPKISFDKGIKSTIKFYNERER